jgi:hypothetical protein
MNRDTQQRIHEAFGIVNGDERAFVRAYKWQFRSMFRLAAKQVEAFTLMMSLNPRLHPSKDNRLRKALGLPRYRARRARAIAAKAGER